MNKPKKYNQYEIPFWGEWLDADMMRRRELIEHLPIIKELCSLGNDKMSKKVKINSIALLLNSLFEDLESAVYIKISEKEVNKNG